MAVLGQSVELLQLLLRAGANVNHQDINGATALMTCLVGNGPVTLELAQVLLEAGARIDAEDTNGLKVCDYAEDWNIMLATFLKQRARESTTISRASASATQ
jgi:ankyrin repeat protein